MILKDNSFDCCCQNRVNIAYMRYFLLNRECFFNISLYTNFAVNKKVTVNPKLNVFDFENKLARPRFLVRWVKGCQKEQSRNIISGSDGKIIAASTIGLTVGDWNFSLVHHPESRWHRHMHTCARARARANVEHPNVHVPNEFTFTPKLRQNINDGPLMAFPFDVRKKRAAGLSRMRELRGAQRNVAEQSSRPSRNSPQSPWQFVVIHIRLGLSLAPSSRHLVGIGQLEFAIGSLPRDARGVTWVRQKLE